jgi:hypothetical protein
MLKVLLYALPLILAVYALVDCIQTDDASVRGLPKIGWIVLIVFIAIIGPVAWLIAGRARGASSGRGLPWTGGPTAGYPDRGGPARRPLAPDDDPEFLAQLRPDGEHEALLEQWERDLRRREEDLRDDDGDEGGGGIDTDEPRR